MTQSIHPTLRDMIALEIPDQVKISPQGTKIAYLVRKTNWNANSYENQCFVHSLEDGKTYQLTRTGNVAQLEWVNEHSLAVLKSKEEEKAQIFLFEDLVGEEVKVTDHKTSVQQFRVFGEGFVFVAADPERDENKPRKDQFGSFTHFEQEESPSAVYYTSLSAVKAYATESRTCTEDEAGKLPKPVIQLTKLFEKPYAIEYVVPSPKGDVLYLNCREKEDLVYLKKSCVFQIRLNPDAALQTFLERERAKAEKKVAKDDVAKEKPTNEKEDVSYLGELRELPLPRTARVDGVSPDGETLLVHFAARDEKMYTQADIWTVKLAELESGDATAVREKLKKISGTPDRGFWDAKWSRSGIYCVTVEGTHAKLARLSEDADPVVLDFQDVYSVFGWFQVADTGRIAFIGASETRFYEVYVCEAGDDVRTAQKITNFGKQIETWTLGTRETIRWASKDGTEIEGVLYKPTNFDPNKKYPLSFVVHGGPTWFSTAYLVTGEDVAYYPSLQLLNKEILILKPNYRGSIGRGQAFMELNKDNLGVGDLWDLEGAIDHLVAQEIVDPAKVGCMGWSQGGYISAFAGVQSDRFAAVSVGAGISDWYTYHISNENPDFTTDYLSASPFRDRSIYEKTAPIANLKSAKTPMLIQHGTEDRRVPVSNATELYRGLKEMGVLVELFLYPGMAHPITKPRENHAVMYQNLTWFSHYLLGEELDLMGEKKQKHTLKE
jgi:dipeptidyl aminopeptidase/acylaminoacyl peptidase